MLIIRFVVLFRSRYLFSRSVDGALQSVTDDCTFPPTCNVVLGPLAFSYVLDEFCYVYQVLSWSSMVKRGRWVVFLRPFVPTRHSAARHIFMDNEKKASPFSIERQTKKSAHVLHN